MTRQVAVPFVVSRIVPVRRDVSREWKRSPGETNKPFWASFEELSVSSRAMQKNTYCTSGKDQYRLWNLFDGEQHCESGDRYYGCWQIN